MLDSATSFVSINDAGVVAFPGLVGGSTQTALFAGSDRSNLVPLHTFAVGLNPLIRPQISNTNHVVYRDDANNIVVRRYPQATIETIASAGLTNSSPFPGISTDGNYVAFTSTGPSGLGIYLARRTGGGPQVLPALVNGIGDP